MKRRILTLLVVAITLGSSVRAATDTNRFILPFFVRDAVFDPTEPRVFVLPDNTNTLDVIDLDTRATQRFPIAGAGQALVMSPDGSRLFVASDTSEQSGSVAVFQLNDVTFVREIGIPVDPHDIVATDNGRIVISGTMSGNPSLTVFDAQTGAQLGNSFDLGAGMNLALHPSQTAVLGFDPSFGRYHRFGLATNGFIATHRYRSADLVYPNVRLFPFPDGTRTLSGTGLIFTNTLSQETDLQGVGSIGGLGLIESAVFNTNQHYLVTASGDVVRYYSEAAEQLIDERRVAEVQYVGSYEDRLTTIVRHPLGGSLSEIRFILPRATNATENLPPVALIEKVDSGTIFPVGRSLQVRAEGRDQDGDIEWTRIFSGTELIAHRTNTVVYEGVPIRPGTNRIYAVVRDVFGALDTSEFLEVFGNHLPVVTIGLTQSDYASVQPIVVPGVALDEDGEVRVVRLVVGNQIIGSDDTAPYQFVFTPSAPGFYNLQLEAEDNLGGINRSEVRTVTFGGGSDDFSRNIPILNGTNLIFIGSNIGATRQKGEPLHAGVAGGKSMWWAWRMPTSFTNSGGFLSIDTFGSNFDTVLAVYSGGPQGTDDLARLKLLAENDDAPNNPPLSQVKCFVSNTDVIYIAVDGREGVAGNIRMRLNFDQYSRPRNDNFLSAPVISSSANGTNVGATREPGEPNHAGNGGGASVWWRFNVANLLPIRISTTRSTFDTLLAVYTTNTPGFFPTVPINNLVLVAENDDANAGTRTSELTFTPKRTGTYWLAVDGYNGAQGAINVTLINHYPVTENNMFTYAVRLTGTLILTNGYNLMATMQPGEPFHAGKTNADASVWYRWTAPKDGLVSLSTRGSDFDTLLAVYTGTTVTNLQAVASNDDDPASTLTSALIFHATAGTEYRIAVAGLGAARGEFVLALNQVPDFTPRLLTQWEQGRLWLNPADITPNTVLQVSDDLTTWSTVHPVLSTRPIEISPVGPQTFFRLKLLE